MQIARKIQLGAAAVIANGLMYLSFLVPPQALANPCAYQFVCVGCTTLAYCQSIAKPGCTATKATCTGPPLCAGIGGTFCFYE